MIGGAAPLALPPEDSAPPASAA